MDQTVAEAYGWSDLDLRHGFHETAQGLRYTISEPDKTITYQIERSSYPNWDGTEQKRPFTVTADELRYTSPAPSSGGAAAQLIWKRAK